MANSKQLAGLIGPSLVALTISETLNFHIWSTNIPPVTYLNGILLFIAGLSIARAHNVWRGWPVLVTVTGWLAVLGGLFRMFAPEARQASASPATYSFLVVGCAVGLFLTFHGYRRQRA